MGIASRIGLHAAPFAIAVAVAVVPGLGCQPPSPVHGSLADAAALQVRLYEGIPLSSIEDFRENSLSGPRYVDRSTYRLNITGLVERDLSLGYDEVSAGFESLSRVVTLQCEEGWDVTLLWEGVRIADLIDAAGVRPDAQVAIFRSVDGYSTSLELDYLYGEDIILAHKMNGVTIPHELGFPFQLVAEGKWGYKWIKWVHEIELSDDLLYEGYWESRGYSNIADLGDSSLDE
jgi:DMSO/TMAO reductase YedYZ molybdopterin-dependent catalytic subunit